VGSDQLELAWDDGPGTGIKNALQFSLADLSEMAKSAVKHNAAGSNVYVGPAGRKCSISKNDRAKSKDVTTTKFAWADADGALDDVMVRCEKHGLEPEIVVHTGTFPEPRAHLYFRLPVPATGADNIKSTNKAVRELLGTDTVHNADRLMRLAGTVSYPNAAKANRGYETELTTLKINKEAEPIDAGKLMLARRHTDGLNGRRYDEDKLARLIVELATPGMWHNSMIRAVGHLVAKGLSDSAIHALADKSWTQEGYTTQQTHDEVQQAIDGAREKGWSPDDQPTTNGSKPIRIDGSFDVTRLPQRNWLAKGLLLQGHLTVVVSPGGIGKSIWSMSAAVGVATGKPELIAGASDAKHGRALVINSEDDNDELCRRLAAILERHEIGPSRLDGKLFIQSTYGETSRIAAYDAGSGEVREGGLFNQVQDFALEHGVSLIVLDPLVGLHNAPENDNGAMEQVALVLRRLAQVTGAAVLVIHHTRKGATGGKADSYAGEMDAGRGASALVNAARIVKTISRMPKEGSKDPVIEWRIGKNLRRIDDAKGNYDPPAEEAIWFELQSTVIANGEYVPSPVLFDMAAVNDRMREEAEKEVDDQLDIKRREVAEAIAKEAREGNEHQPEVISRLKITMRLSRSTAQERLRLLPIGETNSFKFRRLGLRSEIWREQVGSEKQPRYVVHWQPMVGNAP